MFAVALAALAAFLFVGPSTAQAGNLHFVGDVTFQVVGNEVIVSGKVAGLGNGDITYQIEIDAELTIFLVNPGAKGNKPPGQNKEPLHAFDEGVLDGSEDNGQFTFTITVDLTDAIEEALASVDLKNNWTAEQGPLTVTDMSLSISQGDDTITAP
jgi:hypothetical protein